MWTVGLTQLLVKVVRINPPSHHPCPLEALGCPQWEEEMWTSDVWTYFTVATHLGSPSCLFTRWRCSPVNQKTSPTEVGWTQCPASKLLIDQIKVTVSQTLQSVENLNSPTSKKSLSSLSSLSTAA